MRVESASRYTLVTTNDCEMPVMLPQIPPGKIKQFRAQQNTTRANAKKPKNLTPTAAPTLAQLQPPPEAPRQGLPRTAHAAPRPWHVSHAPAIPRA